MSACPPFPPARARNLSPRSTNARPLSLRRRASLPRPEWNTVFPQGYAGMMVEEV